MFIMIQWELSSHRRPTWRLEMIHDSLQSVTPILELKLYRTMEHRLTLSLNHRSMVGLKQRSTELWKHRSTVTLRMRWKTSQKDLSKVGRMTTTNRASRFTLLPLQKGRSVSYSQMSMEYTEMKMATHIHWMERSSMFVRKIYKHYWRWLINQEGSIWVYHNMRDVFRCLKSTPYLH